MKEINEASSLLETMPETMFEKWASKIAYWLGSIHSILAHIIFFALWFYLKLSVNALIIVATFEVLFFVILFLSVHDKIARRNQIFEKLKKEKFMKEYGGGREDKIVDLMIENFKNKRKK